MSYPPAQYPPGAEPPAPRPEPQGAWSPVPVSRPLRRWRHPLLFALTACSLTLAGAMFWPAGEGAVETEGALSLLWAIVTTGLPYAFWVLVILGAHEMGHYLACRYYGIPATLPYFIPGIPPLGSFGAVIRIRGIIPHRRALFDVAAAGPLAGFVIALPVLLVGIETAQSAPDVAEGPLMAFGEPLVLHLMRALLGSQEAIQTNALIGAGWVGMLVTSLNLFPVGQLDGGHAAYALSRRVHRLLTGLTLGGLAGLIVWQVVRYQQPPAYALWFVILLWMRDRHPRLLDEGGHLGAGRTALAVVLLAMLFLSFIPLPLTVIDG